MTLETPMIRLNGEPHALRDPRLTVVLATLGVEIATRGIAVAVNEHVVPRARWESIVLRGGDVVEVVGAVQGG